jgi:hypothetical protein
VREEHRTTRNPCCAYDEHGKEIPPMTLANIRAHGVRSVDALCQAIGCGHEAMINVDGLADSLLVPDVSLRLRLPLWFNSGIRA